MTDNANAEGEKPMVLDDKTVRSILSDAFGHGPIVFSLGPSSVESGPIYLTLKGGRSTCTKGEPEIRSAIRRRLGCPRHHVSLHGSKDRDGKTTVSAIIGPPKHYPEPPPEYQKIEARKQYPHLFP